MENVVSWQPHGRCFKVHDMALFELEVLPLFHHSNFASFRAQLRAYGFTRLVKNGPDKGCYFSEFFLRGMPHLVANIQRRPKTIRGKTRGRPRTEDLPEPDFYKLEFLPEDKEPCKNTKEDWRSLRSGTIRSVLETALVATPKPVTEAAVVSTGPCLTVELTDGAKPASYRDYFTSENKPEEDKKEAKDQGETTDVIPGDQVFLGKLHDLLGCAKDKHVEHIISWQPHGRCFIIRDTKAFEEDLCRT